MRGQQLPDTARNKNNLFSQLKVYKSKTSLLAGVDPTSLQHSPVIDDSKEAFMRKLDAIRIFKEPERELRYLNEVRDIQKQLITNGSWDVIVIGAGAAGLMTCLELPSKLNVLLLKNFSSS